MYKSLMQDESALVVSWYRIIKALVTTALSFAIFGKIIDFAYAFVHGNEILYDASTISTIDMIYGWFGYIPMVVLLMIVIYAINYSIWSTTD